MSITQSKNLCCLIIIVVLCTMTAAPVVCASDTKIAVVVSQKIRPYLQVTDGILDQVSQKTFDPKSSDPGTSPETADSQTFNLQFSGSDVFFLSPEDDLVTTQVIDRLITGAYDLVAAVGPEAADLVWETGIPGKKIYAAVLDPDAVSHIPDDACGISLRIPVPVQLGTIVDAFPSFEKIGLLFNPKHNQWFFEAAAAAADGSIAGGDRPIHIIPLQVSARNHIARVVTENLANIDAVWMIPDQTVISEKLIQYVIKQALYKNTGVIGYNAYFTRTGALFSFEFDYVELGRQVGTLIMNYIAGKECHSVPPLFETRINSQVARKLGLELEAD
jgi:putative ABC transport system substrate-binding protein